MRRAILVLSLLPDAVAAWHALRAGGDPRQHLTRWTVEQTPSMSVSSEWLTDLLAAASWLTRRLYPRLNQRGTCLPRAYTSYRALRRLGYPAVFVSGLTRTAQGVQGHAWIEGPHGPLLEYGELYNRERFTLQFQHPEETEILCMPQA
ncbi:lasso peptide biosynthesis B2 protein [Deinococcus hopiensis]|uniref:lasso peptide biosynthesis B2 protein n=1 Tax=Deinococcus hopiensis TaxID=309885 RepID=UPI000A008A85